MTHTPFAEKLSDLRAVLAKEGLSGFLIPRTDEYQGEYVPGCAERLRWMTGFTGSAGFCAVLKDRAVVLTDGRYSIQVKQQVDAAIFETGDSTKISPAVWIGENTGADDVIGYDPRLHTMKEIRALREQGIDIRPVVSNPVDAVWRDRPAAPATIVETFPLKLAGVAAPEKLDLVAGILAGKKIDAAVIVLSDSIAWLLNIRASDIPHIPVALSYGLLHKDGTFDWFIDAARVTADVRATFGGRVNIIAPSMLEQSLRDMTGKNIAVDEARIPVWFFDTLTQAGAILHNSKDPTVAPKAIKNTAEQNAMRAAHIRDGVAVTRFLKWLSENGTGLTEIDVEKKLEAFRRRAPEYRDSSFDTIAGFGENGAIVHYRATAATAKTLADGNLLLLDSGAQYADGTTDITRTIAIGTPAPEMKTHFTLVLKGHIAVASARFPRGTTGAQIDVLARSALWQQNLDYAHGTGHGVGCYLSVHEEAASLSPRGHDAIEAGMIISNEPGYYKEGAYGIRIENLVMAYDDGVCDATGRTMMAFETLTFAPMDRRLVVPALLTDDEKKWLEQYQTDVFSKVSPYLDDAEKGWLAGYIA